MPVSWFAEVERLVPQKPAGQTQERLEALVTRLHQLPRLRATQSNQRRLLTEAAVLASIDAVIALVTHQIRGFEIAELIASDPLWRKLDETFRSIKGVADRTVARLMAEPPEDRNPVQQGRRQTRRPRPHRPRQRRLLEKNGYRSPAETRRNWMAAALTTHEAA